MRIHTDATYSQICGTVRGTPAIFHTLDVHGSRTHARAYEIRLTGSGGLTNSGRHGAGSFHGATWDEWGTVFAGIFAVDPDARMGGTAAHPVYANAADFHWQTGDRFRPNGLPEDTHPRHRWELAHRAGTPTTETEYRCTVDGCTAVNRWRAHRPETAAA